MANKQLWKGNSKAAFNKALTLVDIHLIFEHGSYRIGPLQKTLIYRQVDIRVSVPPPATL